MNRFRFSILAGMLCCCLFLVAQDVSFTFGSMVPTPKEWKNSIWNLMNYSDGVFSAYATEDKKLKFTRFDENFNVKSFVVAKCPGYVTSTYYRNDVIDVVSYIDDKFYHQTFSASDFSLLNQQLLFKYEGWNVDRVTSSGKPSGTVRRQVIWSPNGKYVAIVINVHRNQWGTITKEWVYNVAYLYTSDFKELTTSELEEEKYPASLTDRSGHPYYSSASVTDDGNLVYCGDLLYVLSKDGTKQYTDNLMPDLGKRELLRKDGDRLLLGSYDIWEYDLSTKQARKTVDLPEQTIINEYSYEYDLGSDGHAFMLPTKILWLDDKYEKPTTMCQAPENSTWYKDFNYILSWGDGKIYRINMKISNKPAWWGPKMLYSSDGHYECIDDVLVHSFDREGNEEKIYNEKPGNEASASTSYWMTKDKRLLVWQQNITMSKKDKNPMQRLGVLEIKR